MIGVDTIDREVNRDPKHRGFVRNQVESNEELASRGKIVNNKIGFIRFEKVCFSWKVIREYLIICES